MTIKNLTKNTINDIAYLALQLWPEEAIEETISHYEEVLKNDTAACFLLQDAEGFAGFIELSTRNDYVEGADDLPVAYIEGLFVTETKRHKGYASLLVQQAMAWAKQKGFKQLCSDTELGNTNSINFHLAAGFSEVNRIVCFIKDVD